MREIGNLMFNFSLYSCDRHPSQVDNWFKKSITNGLNEIHLKMQILLIYKQVPSARLDQKLREILPGLDNKLRQSLTNEAVSKDGSVDVYPEGYQGGKSGYPLYAKKG